MEEKPTEIVIPKEKALFWMDARGYWHNANGRFRVKRIIDHFNRSIHRDAAGYFVSQVNGDRIEKVYFPYEDTALFVTEVQGEDPLLLTLNTGEELPLRPEALFVRDDNLYLERGEERVKFNERSLMRMAERIEEEGGGWVLCIGGRRHPIRALPRP